MQSRVSATGKDYSLLEGEEELFIEKVVLGMELNGWMGRKSK